MSYVWPTANNASLPQSGGFGNDGRLSGLLYNGANAQPQMSVAADVAPSPLLFTGNTGQVANIGLGSGAGMMNYGMSGVPNDVGAGFPTAASEMGLWDKIKGSGFLTQTDKNGLTTQGWGGLALGGAQGIANLWMGMQQYGLAKKQLSESKRQFDLNYGAQRQTANTRMEDRQAARVASNSGAYQSVDAYMAKNAIK